MSRPQPGSRPRSRNKPTIRLRAVSATLIRSPNTVCFVVLMMATVSPAILSLRHWGLGRGHPFTPGYDYPQDEHRQHASYRTNRRYCVHLSSFLPLYLIYRPSKAFKTVSIPGPSNTMKSAGKMKMAKG